MGNLVEVQVAEHRKTTATTRSAQIAELLRSTSLPAGGLARCFATRRRCGS